MLFNNRQMLPVYEWLSGNKLGPLANDINQLFQATWVFTNKYSHSAFKEYLCSLGQLLSHFVLIPTG